MSDESRESYQADILFRVPRTWTDKTIALFEDPAPNDAEFPPRFFVTRHERQGNESIQMYAERMVVPLRKLKGFEVLRNEPSRLANRAAYQVSYRWSSPAGSVTHQHIIVAGAERAILNMCATARTSVFEQYAEVFREIVDSVRLPALVG